jgi:predicted amidophosphoribosyltransferase
MTFEKGEASAVFTLIGDKIVRFDIDSSLLHDRKCPHCGVALTDFGNFCPNCGKPLQERPKAESESQTSQVSNEIP